MTLSYLEIYNENIRDLLRPKTGTLDLREDAKKGTIEVTGLSEVSTLNTKEVGVSCACTCQSEREVSLGSSSANTCPLLCILTFFYITYSIFLLLLTFLSSSSPTLISTTILDLRDPMNHDLSAPLNACIKTNKQTNLEAEVSQEKYSILSLLFVFVCR